LGVAKARAHLTPKEFCAAFAEGKRLDLEQAAAHYLDDSSGIG
jgi:hypothetical protein